MQKIFEQLVGGRLLNLKIAKNRVFPLTSVRRRASGKLKPVPLRKFLRNTSLHFHTLSQWFPNRGR